MILQPDAVAAAPQPCLSENSPSPADAGFDCFNEDLNWILAKLVERTGGFAGVISAQWADASQPTLLAATANSSDDPLIGELTARGYGVPWPPVAAGHDLPHLSHSLMNHHQSDGSVRRYRVLQLAFTPAESVKLIAAVVKESRLGFKFLEESNARRLYPVLSRYIRLWWLHRIERRNARILRAVSDISDLALFLLNRESHLLFANSRAREMLCAKDGLSQDSERLEAVIEAERDEVRSRIAAAVRINQTGSYAGEPVVLQVRRTSQKRDLIVAIMPLAPKALDRDDPAVLIYGLDPDQNSAEMLAPVAAIYKLTDVESRLVVQLVNGCSITEAAERIKVKPQTARAYLKNIFSKTKTHRQADLVRVVLSSTLRTSANIPREFGRA